MRNVSRDSRHSFDPRHFAPLYAAEDHHFWFRARNQLLGSLVNRIAHGMASGYSILEVGCGTGNVLRAVQRACPQGTAVGMDLFGEGLRYARRRTSCHIVQADIQHLPFSSHFDLIGCFDVLEHQSDDVGVLKIIRSILAPQGALLLTVPAHPSLWSYFDEASGHCRRYKLDELELKLTSSGYAVEFITYYMASIFPLVWLRRKMKSLDRSPMAADADNKRRLAQAELRVIPLVNNLLLFLLSQETRFILRRRRLPIGTSILAIARRDTKGGG